MSVPPTFYFRLFGSPSIEADDGGVPLSGRVAQRHRLALLALVAMAPGQRLSRDKLIAYLWPESDSERGRNLLKVSTYVLRSELGETALLSEGDDLRLNADVVRADALELEAALARGDHAAAVTLYESPFLDGFFLSDAPDFEQWAARERERLAAQYAKALEALAEGAETKGDASGAAEWWKKRAAQDPYDSRVALRLMRSLEASGNRAAALQHASIHQRLLEQEFGIATAPEITAFAEQLRSKPLVAAEASAPPRASPEPAAHPSAPHVVEQEARSERGRARALSRKAAIVLAAVVLLVGAVWAIGPGFSRPPERSIAVLPFISMSADGDDESFNDGLTEEIITGLSAVPELRVISRTSAMHYKGTEKPLPEIARELGVAHILEGSVRRAAGRVRISAQLIDARADEHLWAENYETDLRDVFRVQEQIARQVVRALEVELDERGNAALVRQGTRDPEAYRFYQRARYLWNTRTRDGHQRAIEYYQRAIELDSNYADAYAGLADTYRTAWQLNVSDLSEAEVFARSKWAAERALALDDKSADAHVSFAASLQTQKNWPGMERELLRAIELNPSHATARTWYGLLLAGMGRPREALEQSRRAYELDPFAVVPSGNYGWQCYLARDSDCAIDQYQRTLEIAPGYGRTHARLGFAYAQKGMLDEAVRALRTAIEHHPERPDFVADLAYVQALRGETAAARETLDRAKRQPFEPFNIGRAYVALREPDSAFAWLERATWQWPHRAVLSDPALEPLRADPRFARLTARVERDMGIR
ncbi:MAG TPA: tetratricopeptide repeat protein [Gemmatimonadaceae bacterium]|nr:tetratricopeptide repeat protein [Gemmatimonadaceae bacterium]